MNSDFVRIAFVAPRPLRRKAEEVLKRRGGSLSSLARDGLEAEINRWESKIKSENFHSQPEPKRLVGRPRIHPIKPLQERGPVRFNIPMEPIPDLLNQLFEQHAARLAKVINSPLELESRQRVAINDIRKMAPLRYADDERIVSRLETIISERLETSEVHDALNGAQYEDEGDVPLPRVPDEPPPMEKLMSFAQRLREAPEVQSDELTGKSLKLPIPTRKLIDSPAPTPRRKSKE